MGGKRRAHLLPALTLKPTVTGYDDKAGAYTEWLVPEGVGRVRFDLVGGAGGAATSFTPQYLTDVTNAPCLAAVPVHSSAAFWRLSPVTSCASGRVTVASAPQPAHSPHSAAKATRQAATPPVLAKQPVARR